MSAGPRDGNGLVPEIDLSDIEVVRDPFAAYGRARERSPLARIQAPGFGTMWALTRHEGAKAAVARRRAEPGDDLVSDLVRAQAEDGDRLDDTETVALVWHLVLAGQTPTNLIANAVEALLSHPDQLTALRDDPGLMPRAIEELMRWCGPTLLSIPRYAREDVELFGTLVRKGEAVTAAVAAANRDPRAFADPDRLDVSRPAGPSGHLGFAHGPHFCLGASLARVQTQIAITALLRRFPGLALAVPPPDGLRALDPGTWRLTALPVTL